MPRFYLHLRQGDALVEDPDGEESVSVAEARDAAKAAAREIMSEEIRQGELPDLQQPL